MTESKVIKKPEIKKKRKPKFIRQDVYKLKRLKNKSSWRRPKGKHSKLRCRKAHQKLVSTGYGSPNEIKFTEIKSGLLPVLVNNLNDMENIDTKEQGVIISKQVGKKNKIKLLEKASELKIHVINYKNPLEYLKEQKLKLEKVKETKAKKKEEKKTKEKTAKKEEKESIEDKLSEDEKKKLEKKEIDRLLTKKF